MIECRLTGGPLNGHVKLVRPEIVHHGEVYFTLPIEVITSPGRIPVKQFNRVAYRVKSANSQTATLEYSE